MRLSYLNNRLARQYRARYRQRKVLRDDVFVTEEYYPFGDPNQKEQENLIHSIASQVGSLCVHNVFSTPVTSSLSTQDTTVAISDVDSRVTGGIALNPNFVATTATATTATRGYYDDNVERIERLEQEMQEMRALVRQLVERDIS